MSEASQAPGKPGIAPRWTTSRKSGVGTARAQQSHVWFATHDGILGEVFYPRVDIASVRDMGMLVTDGKSFFSEEKTGTQSKAAWLHDGVPGFHLTNTCNEGRYVIEKEIVTDPDRHVLLQRTKFRALKGKASDYHLYVLAAPHLGDQGKENTARVEEFKGVELLAAERNGTAMALACSALWLARSAGFVGVSDGWQDLHTHYKMTWHYKAAEGGNVALIGEIDLSRGQEFVLALGFGATTAETAHRARSSLDQGFERSVEKYTGEWSEWQKSLRPLAGAAREKNTAYRTSTAMLAAHESKDFRGGTIASLSFPWGEASGDDDKAGYHMVWPRDTFETAGALLAAGTGEEILRALDFFRATQEADGHWPQNMWMDGSEFWKGIQLDEVAAPILLADLARRHGRLNAAAARKFWPMARKAVGYIVRNGPSSPQDRWEEDSGLTSYTLGAMIAALLGAGEMADEFHERKLGDFLRETADAWNDSIERWTYVEGTALARKVGVPGYYVRVAAPSRLAGRKSISEGRVKIKNRDGRQEFAADEIVSVDALALVRFGLRSAKDPRILHTVKVIDSLLKVETPKGPCWHRYNYDGYGEKADGSPFEKTGIGRAWPLLTGERAHYELAAGNVAEARRLRETMEALASDSGLISEQVWDTEAIPEKGLFPGRPSGSARPLVWAHAEHVKLIRSLEDGAVFDMPPQTVKRYLTRKHSNSRRTWRFAAKICNMPAGDALRIETLAQARIRWSSDDWKTVRDEEMTDTGIGLFYADLPTKSLPVGARLFFTFFWVAADRWEGEDFHVVVVNKSE